MGVVTFATGSPAKLRRAASSTRSPGARRLSACEAHEEIWPDAIVDGQARLAGLEHAVQAHFGTPSPTRYVGLRMKPRMTS